MSRLLFLFLAAGFWQGTLAVDYISSAVIAKDVKDLKQLEKLTPAAKKGRTALTCSGSGFFIDVAGRVVTNHHVVKDAQEIVMLYDGVAYSMKIVAKNSTADLALLEFDGLPRELDEASANRPSPLFPKVVVRSKTPCEAGEQVFVVGYPQIGLQGIESKVTKGIVSSVTGFQGEKENFQMDAPIQHGNSGGPVFDGKGELVGVAVAMLRVGQNVNYAITSAELLKFLPREVAVSKDLGISDKSDVAMVRRVRKSTVLLLCFSSADSGSMLESEMLQSKDAREANENRTRLQKTILYARLLKLRKEWQELKQVTEGLMATGVADSEVTTMNAMAREELGEHLIVYAEAEGKDVKARIKPICGIRDAFVECEVAFALEDGTLKRGFPVKADLEYRTDEGVWSGSVDEIYNWKGTKEIRVKLKKIGGL